MKYGAFLSQKNIKCKEYECQSWCKECKLSPYAIINGEFITAVTSKELFNQLKLIVEGKKIIIFNVLKKGQLGTL